MVEVYSEQFNIAMWVTTMTFKQTLARTVGASPSSLLPQMVGLHSFRIITEERRNSVFQHVTAEEMFAYLTERQ